MTPPHLRPYDSVLETIGWTPLIRLGRIGAGLQTPIYGKAEYVNPGGSVKDRPSFAFFEMHINEIFPHLRGDREFVQLLIDTLRVERPAYRALHQYMLAHNWPSWSG